MASLTVARRRSRVPVAARRLADAAGRGRAPEHLLVVVPAALLALVPFLVWTQGSAVRMNLGGDDSHLMFAYPGAWLSHMSFSALDHNLVGYNPHTYFVPLAALLWVAQQLHLNAEAAFFAAVLAAAYVGYWRLGRELLPPSPVAALAATLGALVAVLAPVVAETQWSSMLLRIEWEALLPWIVLLLIWYQRTGAWRHVLWICALVALGAPAINDAPTTIACGILLALLLVVATMTGSLHWSLRRTLVFAGAALATNLFWIGPAIGDLAFGQVQTVDALSSQGRESAVSYVAGLAPYTDWTDVIGLRLAHPLVGRYLSNMSAVDDWHRNLWYVGLLPVGLVVAGVVLSISSGVKRRARALWLLAAGAVLFTYFASLTLVPGGVAVFSWLLRNAPGWVAERNYFDKFAIPLAAVMGLAAALASWFVLRRVPRMVALAATCALAGAFAVYDAPFLRGDEFSLPYAPSVETSRVMNGLSPDFVDAAQALADLPAGGVLSIPLSGPAWTIVPRAGAGASYIGVSPITVLTGRSDFNGIEAFGSAGGGDAATLARGDMAAGDFVALARLSGALGARYVILYDGDTSGSAFQQYGAVPGSQVRAEVAAIRAAAPQVLARRGSYEVRALDSSLFPPAVYQVAASCTPPSLAAVNFGVASFESSCRPVSLTASVTDTEWSVPVSASEPGTKLILGVPVSTLWHASMTCAGNEQSTPLAAAALHAFGMTTASPGCAGVARLAYAGQGLVRLAAVASGMACLIVVTVPLALLLRRRRRSGGGW
jgi:hypothetical protein